MAGLTLKSLQTSLLGPIDLTIAPGDCVCMSGPSGSGKSLTLRAVADLDPHEGELFLNDTPSTAMSGPQWRRQVGYLTAESQWWAETVGEHFIDGREFAEKVGFSKDVMDWSVNRLSTGEKQRLALARLLGNRPKVLLLDEPTAALDPENISRVESLVESYRSENNAAVLWVSHDPEQVNRVASRHYRFEQGRIRKVQ